jgi:hypothetical protein
MHTASSAALSQKRWCIYTVGIIANEYKKERHTKFDQSEPLGVGRDRNQCLSIPCNVAEFVLTCSDSEDLSLFQVQRLLGIHIYVGENCQHHDEGQIEANLSEAPGITTLRT